MHTMNKPINDKAIPRMVSSPSSYVYSPVYFSENLSPKIPGKHKLINKISNSFIAPNDY